MALTIDIHAIHTLPPSNINRDDTGAPKSAIFGGVVRQRVSSQAFKRAIRKDFQHRLDRSQLGYRTKRVVDLIAHRILELDSTWNEERATAAAEALFKAAKIKVEKPKLKEDEHARPAESGYLMFLSDAQVRRAAEHLLEHDGETISAKTAKDLLDQEHSVDVAMFGRMIAEAPDYNVDAAVQVAHAIGVHESEPEFDFFTAVDDLVEDQEETGAGMLGTVQMMSSTLYRYAAIDMESLAENLGSRDAAAPAAIAFVESFLRALPTGKLNTFANWTLPELVYVVVRDDRPVSLVNAFETPVTASGERSRRAAAADALAAEARELDAAYGLTSRAAWVMGLGDLSAAFDGLADRCTRAELLDALGAELAKDRA